MEEYLKLVLEQVRCQKAHSHIREELQTHMEEQIADNLNSGMNRKEAEEAAVRDMGSPVETGIALDRIHRPQAAWGMIALMAVISIAGILLHLMISRQTLGYEEEITAGSTAFALHSVIGLALMMLVYHMDYSVIARLSKIIMAAIIMLGLYGLVGGSTMHGVTRYVWILGLRLSLLPMMILCVPLYGAVIYKYYGMGYGGVVKSILWMFVPVLVTFKLPGRLLAIIMLVSMSAVLTVAVAKGWFQVAKKKVIASLWSFVLVLPAASLSVAYFFGLLKNFQTERLRAFLTNSGAANYVTTELRSILGELHFVGNNGREWATIESLPAFNSDFVFSYMLSDYGVLVGGGILCLLAVLVVKVFTISFRQKNQLGMSMGCGCGMILLLNMMLNIGECLGLLPVTETFLPFFSAGGGNLIVCYVLMGMILSIYRYKNVHAAHINTKLPSVKLMIEL